MKSHRVIRLATWILGVAFAVGLISAPTPANAGVPHAATCQSSVTGSMPPPQLSARGIPGFHAQWYGQSGYMSLCPGALSTATVAYLNTGHLGWVRGIMGQAAYLGTWGKLSGQDQPSVLGGTETGWPRANRLAVQPSAYVGPGQVGWFQFGVRAPLTPGVYVLALRPLIEGALWMEDYGVFWVVTVLTATGALPASPAPIAAGTPAGRPALKSGPARYGRQYLPAGQTMTGGTIDAQGQTEALVLANDTTVDGVEIFNTGSGYGGGIIVDGDRVKIHDCFLHNLGSDGINANREGDLHGIKDLTITNCLIQDTGQDAIHIKGTNRGDGQAPTQNAAMENIRITYTKAIRISNGFSFELQDGCLNNYYAYNESDRTYSVVGHTGVQMIGNTVTTTGWGFEVGNMINGLWDSNTAQGSLITAFAYSGDTVNSNMGTTYSNNRISDAQKGFWPGFGQHNTFTNNGFHNVGTWMLNGTSYDSSSDVRIGAYGY